MTGLGEDVYEDRSTALDALTEESQRMGMYGDAPDVEKMVERAAKARWAKWREEWEAVEPKTVLPVWEHIGPAAQAATLRCERAALESLGIPLSVLTDLKDGKRVAMLTCSNCAHGDVDQEVLPCSECLDGDDRPQWEAVR